MSLATPAADPPDGLSRRHLMRQAAAVGAAGLAATLVTGAAPAGAATGAADHESTDHGMAAGHDEPMIVHVRDARTGHLDLYSGERHHRVQDPALAAALVRALG